MELFFLTVYLFIYEFEQASRKGPKISQKQGRKTKKETVSKDQSIHAFSYIDSFTIESSRIMTIIVMAARIPRAAEIPRGAESAQMLSG